MSDVPAAPAAAPVADSTAPTDSAEASVEAKAETPAEKRYRLKVNGQDREFSEAEVLKRAQIAEAAQERFQKAAHLEKLEQAIQQGDRRAIQKLLGDERFHNFAVDYFNERLAEEEMSPKERELKHRERQLMEYEERMKAEEEERKSTVMQQLEDHYAQKFDAEFSSAMKELRLPPTPKAVARMAELMKQNLEMGLELPATSIAQLVKDELTTTVKSIMDGLDDESLAALLGEQVEEKIRRRSMGKLKSPVSNNRLSGSPSKTQDSPKKSGDVRLSKEDFKARMEAIKRGEL
jgi:hypothetical protein